MLFRQLLLIGGARWEIAPMCRIGSTWSNHISARLIWRICWISWKQKCVTVNWSETDLLVHEFSTCGKSESSRRKWSGMLVGGLCLLSETADSRKSLQLQQSQWFYLPSRFIWNWKAALWLAVECMKYRFSASCGLYRPRCVWLCHVNHHLSSLQPQYHICAAHQQPAVWALVFIIHLQFLLWREHETSEVYFYLVRSKKWRGQKGRDLLSWAYSSSVNQMWGGNISLFCILKNRNSGI